jgi:hypothetical protein
MGDFSDPLWLLQRADPRGEWGMHEPPLSGSTIPFPDELPAPGGSGTGSSDRRAVPAEPETAGTAAQRQGTSAT